jgi:ABC-type phosphate transport system substrate-binding protein
MKKLGIVITLIVLVGAVWGFLKIKSDDTKIEKLVLTGSSTVAPLAAEIGKRFESLHTNVMYRPAVPLAGSAMPEPDLPMLVWLPGRSRTMKKI